MTYSDPPIAIVSNQILPRISRWWAITVGATVAKTSSATWLTGALIPATVQGNRQP